MFLVMSLNLKEKKRKKKKKVKEKERKEKVPQEKQTVFASKEAVARSKHWYSASVVIGYFALTYEGVCYSYSALSCIHYSY